MIFVGKHLLQKILSELNKLNEMSITEQRLRQETRIQLKLEVIHGELGKIMKRGSDPDEQYEPDMESRFEFPINT